MAKHVFFVRINTGERHDDTRAIRLGNAAGLFRQLLTNDVRLLEVRMISVEDQRFSIERMPERIRMACIPTLGHAAGVAYHQRFRWIKEIVEMLRLENFPVEG